MSVDSPQFRQVVEEVARAVRAVQGVREVVSPYDTAVQGQLVSTSDRGVAIALVGIDGDMAARATPGPHSASPSWCSSGASVNPSSTSPAQDSSKLTCPHWYSPSCSACRWTIFLIGRIREYWETTGDYQLAVAAGLTHTARPITAAAAIMIVVFGSFITADMLELKQIGFALAIAVAINALFVRLILVPALMRLLGRWNWWLPHSAATPNQ